MKIKKWYKNTTTSGLKILMKIKTSEMVTQISNIKFYENLLSHEDKQIMTKLIGIMCNFLLRMHQIKLLPVISHTTNKYT
jgi:hypothetical protein